MEDGGGVVRRTTLVTLMAGALVIAAAGDVHAVVTCPSNGNAMLPQGGDGQDLEVTGTCKVGKGTYAYGNVNIYGTAASPATLKFRDATIDFKAHSILVENYGYLLAGWSSSRGEPHPIGTRPDSKLAIEIYGADGDRPITCKSGPTCAGDLELERRSHETAGAVDAARRHGLLLQLRGHAAHHGDGE